jgi:D-glycero-D-manno-heptose 1,7-bisphosphate phosphatase
LTAGRRALFLDRDGVVNVDRGYVCTPDRTEFIDGIFELCRAAHERGYLLVVVTNQAGIARGYYSEQDFLGYMQWVRNVFAGHGAPLDAVYYCPHHPSEGVGDYLRNCDCRKPNPGMLLAAQRDWDIDMEQSVLVGDKPSDIEAGQRAGVGRCLLISTASTDSGRVTFDEHDMRSIRSGLDGGDS